jgi:hypothetical protein
MSRLCTKNLVLLDGATPVEPREYKGKRNKVLLRRRCGGFGVTPPRGRL